MLRRQAAEGDLGKGEAMGLEGSKMALGVIVNWSFPRTAGTGCHLGRGRAELGQRQWGGGERSPRGLQSQKSAQEPQEQGEEPQGRMDGRALKRSQRGHSHREGTAADIGPLPSPTPGAPVRHRLSCHRTRNSREEKRQWVWAQSWGSGSQQEACSRPLEPQEGEQAPGEGGSEGVDEFL